MKYAFLAIDDEALALADLVASLREADRILVLEDGAITAQGNHEELLKSCGRYRRMAELQMGGPI